MAGFFSGTGRRGHESDARRFLIAHRSELLPNVPRGLIYDKPADFEVNTVTTETTSPPAVVPKAAVTLPTLIASLIAALLGGMHFAQPVHPVNPHVTPTPAPIVKPDPAPAPDLDPVVVPPRPPPVPVPVPTPPTPIVTPPVIISGITVTDLHGKPIGNSVEPGQMFSVTAPPGIVLTPVASNATDADFVEIAESKFVAVLRNGCQLQVIASGGGSKPSLIAIQCNHAPQPPPVPIPQPVPVTPPGPSPAPVPITNKGPVTIAILEDAANRPVAMASILSNHGLWDKYRTAGHKVRVFHAGEKPSTEAEAQSDMAALKQNGIPIPGLVVRNQSGAVLYAGKMLMTPVDVTSTLAPFTGVTQ